MDSLPSFLVHALELPPLLKYGVIVLISLFEGPLLFTVSGFLLRLGAEYFLPLFVALGNLLGDTLWYCFGYYYAGKMVRKRGSFFGITTDHLLTSERIFEKHQGWMLFMSKVTLGFGTSVGIPAMLTAAGMSKVSFKRYMALNLAGEIVLLVFFMSIGYVFGLSYQSVSKDMRILTLVSLAVVFACLALIARHHLLKKRLVLEEEAIQ